HLCRSPGSTRATCSIFSFFARESAALRKRQNLPFVNCIRQRRRGDIPGEQAHDKDLPPCHWCRYLTENHAVQQKEGQQEQPEQDRQKLPDALDRDAKGKCEQCPHEEETKFLGMTRRNARLRLHVQQHE